MEKIRHRYTPTTCSQFRGRKIQSTKQGTRELHKDTRNDVGQTCAEGWRRRLGTRGTKPEPIPGSATSSLPALGQAPGAPDIQATSAPLWAQTSPGWVCFGTRITKPHSSLSFWKGFFKAALLRPHFQLIWVGRRCCFRSVLGESPRPPEWLWGAQKKKQ